MLDAAQGSDFEPDGYVLPGPLPVKSGESLPSLILRNAEPYRFRNPVRLLRRLPHRVSRLSALAFTDPASPFGRDLARLLGLTPERFGCISYGTEDAKVCRVLGHKIHHDFVSVEDRRYCPLCLQEGAYHRAVWDVSVIRGCPEHRVRLVGRCPEGHPVNWRTDRICRCVRIECRADFRDAVAEQVPADELEGVGGLVAMLGGAVSVGFAPMSPGDAVRACFHLGAIARGHHFSPRPVFYAAEHPDETTRILNEGWSALMDWPRGFHALLARLRAGASERRGRYGLRKEFGHLPTFLAEVAEEPFGILLAAEFNRYVAGQEDLATRAHQVRELRSSDELRDRHLTATDAKKLLGTKFETLTARAKQDDLYLVPPTGKGAASLLRADRVHAMLEQRAALLSKEDVRSLLGCSKGTANKLTAADLLHTVPDPDNPGGVRYPAMFAYGLLEDLESRVTPGARGLKDGVTMAAITRQVNRSEFDVCDVIQAVRAGKLRPAGRDPGARGLHRFLFRQADVDRFVTEVTSVPGRTLSVVEAAAELGVKQEVAYHWARTGLLETTTVASPDESGRRVTRADLEAFRAEHVTAVEFAERHGLGRKWAAKHLEEAGIQPVSGPTVDGARQALFRRAHLEGFDAERLVSGRSKLRPTGERRSADIKASYASDAALEAALRREFGDGLVRRYKVYRDAAAALVIQAMAARNSGTTGTYGFLLSTKQRDDLAAARKGFVALAFYDRPDFLLVPWRALRPKLASMRTHDTPYDRAWRIVIRATASGRLEPFGECVRPLAEAVEG